jgi:hypothetical protein
MHIVTQLSGRIMALYSQALVWLKVLRYKLVNNLRANYIQVSLSVVNLWNHLVKILLTIKVLLANLIIRVQLIKVGLKHVAITSGQIGQQLLTTARQIRQRVLSLLKRGR